ncbi:LppX_LprAFG lipoprotein [Janibacter cremeus]|uniref:Lipoprotein LprG n=1 Tax=Janibacter cremeus TaxID=1285192 RepID=A0A852VXR2_9MICO|nr:LppX_LprAFG lipoprotein [Janibacter cremeus]NYF98555.1 lipoprotein LprG [Janibacter cremeus]
MRRRAVLVSLPLALALVSACSVFEETTPPDEALASAQETFVDAGTVAFDLKQSAIPKGRNGVSAASGSGIIDATTPKFRGQVTGVINGNSAGVEIIAVDTKTWMSFFTEDFNPVDMADLGAPNPAEFFRAGSGVDQILATTTDAEAGDRVRDGKTVLQEYTGTVPAEDIQRLFNLGETATEFDVTYGIEPESGELRAVTINGDFYKEKPTTFALALKDYGKDVEITAPK